MINLLEKYNPDTTVKIELNNVQNIEGLEKFTKLKYLGILNDEKNNNITSIEGLHTLVKLNILFIHNTGIYEVP